jgi:hypothetical protein
VAATQPRRVRGGTGDGRSRSPALLLSIRAPTAAQGEAGAAQGDAAGRRGSTGASVVSLAASGEGGARASSASDVEAEDSHSDAGQGGADAVAAGEGGGEGGGEGEGEGGVHTVDAGGGWQVGLDLGSLRDATRRWALTLRRRGRHGVQILVDSLRGGALERDVDADADQPAAVAAVAPAQE